MELCVIEGDGIGREVVPATLEVLAKVIPELDIKPARAGWDCFQETGSSLPDKTIEQAQSSKAVLFGACNSPAYPVKDYFSPIVRLRQILNTYANLRPTRYLPVPTARPGVNLLVVRENTEGLYGGEERIEAGGDTTTATKIVTREATERIAKMAYTLAERTNRKLVTIVHKGNVFPKTDGMFRQICYDISEHHSSIETDDLLVDTAAYWMVKEPTRFDVVLTPNLYGDILSDMAAAWGGGLGLAPALNLGEHVAIAEPVHGSAPDIAAKGIANPTAMILSAAMLVRHHWNLPESANQMEQAVQATLNEGTYTGDIRTDGAISTEDFVKRVCDHL